MVTTAAPTRTNPHAQAAEPRRGPGARIRGRWRVALRFGARDARRHKGRTALVAIMVALPVCLGSFAATVLWSMQTTPERRIAEQLGPSLQASIAFAGQGALNQTPSGDSFGGGELAPEPVTLADLDAALAAALPTGTRPTTALAADVVAFGEDLQTFGSAVQADLADPAVAEAFPVDEGALPGPGEVAVSRRVADELHLALGEDLTANLNRVPGSAADLGSATLSGILADDQPRGATLLFDATGPLTAPGNLADPGWTGTQLWFVSGETPVTWQDVLALNASSLVVTSRAVLTDPPPDSAVPYYGGMPATSTSDILATWGIVGAVIAIALLEAVLLIGPAFAVSARRSARALAIVAANGGTARSLRAVVLGTGVVIGALAALAGAALGITGAVVFVATADSLRFLSVPWPIVTAIAVVGALIATAGAWLPARGASKADVVAVLAGRRGEVTAKRWPTVVGTVAAVGGFGAAVVGGLTTQTMLILGGVIVGELGLVLACGGIVAGLGRLATRLPLTWRFALRDASRHRSRTAPAIAAVLVATAGASAGIVYATAQAEYNDRSLARTAAPGTLVLAVAGDDGILTDQDVATVREVTADLAPGVDLLPVTTLVPPAADDGTVSHIALRADGYVGGAAGYAIWGPVVDDGSLVDVLGLPDPAAARAALADGRVVVLAGQLSPDGTATLAVDTWAEGADRTDGPLATREVALPGTAVGDPRGPSNTTLPIVPPSALADLADTGATAQVGGLVSATPVALTSAERQTLQARLDDALGTGEWGSSRIGVNVGEDTVDLGSPAWLPPLIILGAGAVLALAAAWIAAALAATESRPDLATLTAVGAPPRARKRIVAAQAGTIAGIGALVGVTSGYPLGAAFVLFQRYRWDEADLAWGLTFPWPWLLALLIGLPVLAVTAARLATRSRLVLTRRVAG